MNALTVPPRPHAGLIGAQMGKAAASDQNEGCADRRASGYFDPRRLMRRGGDGRGGDGPTAGSGWRRGMGRHWLAHRSYPDIPGRWRAGLDRGCCDVFDHMRGWQSWSRFGSQGIECSRRKGRVILKDVPRSTQSAAPKRPPIADVVSCCVQIKRPQSRSGIHGFQLTKVNVPCHKSHSIFNVLGPCCSATRVGCQDIRVGTII